MPVDRKLLVPVHDKERLQALARYRIAGSAPEKLFDDLAQLTAKLFGAPMAFVSLVTEDTVWFKASYGAAGAEQVPRENSMCSVVVLRTAPVVAEDVVQNPSPLVNPDVATDLNMQFYAGVPLKDAGGQVLGSLCIVDQRPRTFSEQELLLLSRLAEVVMRAIELRLASLQAGETPNAQLQLAYDALYYSLDRITDLGRTSQSSSNLPARDTEHVYRVASEIVDYVNRFVGGTLQLV
ncbi:GAF domain-containing protein [Hymenobacter koreensis]|uniref:GAF domain-containing protein n=1 Tax=Hymenobacter koreensis TaxID=1084523 RepID=A0ABP8J3T1_9BACT